MGPLTNRQVSAGMAFFTDFVVTGAVRGADATSTPAEVTALLGDGFVESRTRLGQLLRCYDLVEVAWEREGDGLRGFCITVQAHRLDVPLPVDELAADLDRAGFPLVEVAPDGVGCRRFVRADSRVGVLVDEESGQVLALTAPAWFAPGPRGEPSPWPREAGRDRVRHLAGLGAAEREAWARRRQRGQRLPGRQAARPRGRGAAAPGTGPCAAGRGGGLAGAPDPADVSPRAWAGPPSQRSSVPARLAVDRAMRFQVLIVKIRASRWASSSSVKCAAARS